MAAIRDKAQRIPRFGRLTSAFFWILNIEVENGNGCNMMQWVIGCQTEQNARFQDLAKSLEASHLRLSSYEGMFRTLNHGSIRFCGNLCGSRRLQAFLLCMHMSDVKSFLDHQSDLFEVEDAGRSRQHMSLPPRLGQSLEHLNLPNGSKWLSLSLSLQHAVPL